MNISASDTIGNGIDVEMLSVGDDGHVSFAFYTREVVYGSREKVAIGYVSGENWGIRLEGQESFTDGKGSGMAYGMGAMIGKILLHLAWREQAETYATEARGE
jgi:hypothetical protein